MTGADILARAAGAAAVLCCPAEKLDAEIIAKLPDSVRVIGDVQRGLRPYRHGGSPGAGHSGW